MMKFIHFDSEKCDSCYKCLRMCPTKAISFNKNQRHIVDNLCIKCGKCQQVCPRDALSITSAKDKVYEMIKSDYKVVASIAPSYVGAFGLKEPGKVIAMLKIMGFTAVEETALGADMVVEEYKEYLKNTDQDVVITSCCPSAYYLIEQHYAFMIPSLIPVVSPMVAHGKSIKARFGPSTKTVFIGPCLSKMAEAEEAEGAIDAVLTFAELDQMMKDSPFNIHDCEPENLAKESSQLGRAFPLGINLEKTNPRFRFLHVDGAEECKEVLREVRSGSLKNCCIEINICKGSCLGGPDMPANGIGTFGRKLLVEEYIKTKKTKPSKMMKTMSTTNLTKRFQDKQALLREPNISIVHNIMNQMGKFTKEDELNCGACGYQTCYEKAKAVFYGFSDIETCLPYLQSKAESMQSIMIEHSPNAVVVMDKDLLVKEINPTFGKIFNRDNLPVEEMPIKLFIDHTIFDEVLSLKESVINRKIFVEEYDKHFYANIIYIDESQTLIGFLTDITMDVKQKKEFEQVKEETLLKTQEVIDKQMRVAQEIASLLGETTAETKMSLKSLNDLVLRDKGVS